MKSLREQICDGELILDGAMGTQLMARGATGNNELWGVEHPDALTEIHQLYAGAGSQAVTTNSFGGSRLKLEKAKLGDRMEELNERLAAIAYEAVGDSTWVLGDLGPTGEFLQPYGLLTEEQMVAVFREQAEALAAGGVHGFIVETMMDPNEAACAVRGAREAVPGLPVLATMTFDVNPKGFRTMMGTTPEVAATTLAEAGADAVGANCGGITIEQYIDLISEMKKAVDLPLIAQANAGLPEIEDGGTVFREPPAKFAEYAVALREAGVKVFGGCCGTTPAHIKALAEALGT